MKKHSIFVFIILIVFLASSAISAATTEKQKIPSDVGSAIVDLKIPSSLQNTKWTRTNKNDASKTATLEFSSDDVTLTTSGSSSPLLNLGSIKDLISTNGLLVGEPTETTNDSNQTVYTLCFNADYEETDRGYSYETYCMTMTLRSENNLVLQFENASQTHESTRDSFSRGRFSTSFTKDA